ncbi:MAG TPA: metal-dependent hydrolase [Candidatus Woesebacteria bacterium]|nr:metal-dependent hydrolase [Candidatus Woesebacteria bacterium]
MQSRTHQTGALAGLIAMTMLTNQPIPNGATVLVALIANVVGSLLPDLDQAGNRLWDLLPGGNVIGKVFRNLFLSHRTISHSLLGFGIAYLINDWIIRMIFNGELVNSQIVLGSLLIGYGSHIFLDFLTEEGVLLLFPIKWKFRIFRINSGGWVENWIIFSLLVVAIIWMLFFKTKTL